MARTVDLKARRAARHEAKGEAPTVDYEGTTFTLPVELPLTFVEALQANQLATACRELFGERGDEFISLVKPSIEDLGEIATLYGQGLGES
jgi:hypothetical protein